MGSVISYKISLTKMRRMETKSFTWSRR